MITEQTFTTEIENPTIAGLGKLFGVSHDIDVETTYNPKVKVEWSFSIEAREWGIKSISAVATRLTATIEWTASTESMSEEDKAKLITAGGREYPGDKEYFRDGYIEGVYEFDSKVKINDKDWDIDSDISTDGGSIYPDDCGFDFGDMSVYVN